MMLVLRELKHGAVFRVRNIVLTGQSIITFGRSIAATYQLENIGTLSRVQATLKADSDGWWVVDGSINQLSSGGIYFDESRIVRPLLLESGMQITLFSTPAYSAMLEVIDLEGVYLEHPTNPGEHQNFDIASLGAAIATLSVQVAKLTDRVNDSERAVQGQFDALFHELHSDISRSIAEELSATLEKKIDELGGELRPEIRAAHDKNGHQDLMIKRVVMALAAMLIGVSGYKLSKGDPDAIARGIDIASMLVGVSGGAAVAFKPKDGAK